jgi:hypothetical protein
MKDQRHSFTPLEGNDFPEYEPMVTARLHGVHPAVQAAQRTRQWWRFRIVPPVRVDVELLATTACEVRGEIALLVAKHMHRERRSWSECRQARALIGETPQYQWWIERD